MISIHRIFSISARTAKAGSAWVELHFKSYNEAEDLKVTLFFETLNRGDNTEEERFAANFVTAINSVPAMINFVKETDDFVEEHDDAQL